MFTSYLFQFSWVAQSGVPWPSGVGKKGNGNKGNGKKGNGKNGNGKNGNQT